MPDELNDGDQPGRQRLNSWKEISAYLEKKPGTALTTRTFLRWRTEHGLPVHKKRGFVYAYADELDEWLARGGDDSGPEKPPETTETQLTETAPAPEPKISCPPADARRTSVFRRRALSLAVPLLLILAGVPLCWWLWPMDVQLLSCRQLTRDGRPKNSLFTDGERIYFYEEMDGKRVVASLPVSGGIVTELKLPVRSPGLLSISSVRHSLVVNDGESKELFEVQIKPLTVQQIPLPSGVTATSARWDPDGHLLAVVGSDSSLMVFEPGKTSKPRRWPLRGQPQITGWRPRGGRLRLNVLETKSDTTQWWELTGLGLVKSPVPSFSPNRKEENGNWSADGRFFVFEGGRDLTQIWLADEGGYPARPHQLTDDARLWDSPSFIPGSNTIVAMARQSQGELTALQNHGEPGGNNPVLPVGSMYELDYSRDGQWVAYTQFPEHTIWKSRPDGSEARPLTPTGITAHQPHWSPDGTRIAFIGSSMGKDARMRIYLVSSSGGTLDQPLPQGDDQGVPTWTPDGRSIIFGDLITPVGFENATIHELNLQTQTVSNIVAPTGLWSPRMSPDGRHLVAISYDRRSILVRDNQRGSWRNCATMEFLEEPVWSPDSHWFQFIAKVKGLDAKGVYRLTASCGQPQRITDLSSYRFAGATWIGIGPNASVLGLVGLPAEIYTLDWRLQPHLPSKSR